MENQIESQQILFTRGVPPVEALPNTLLSECMQAALEGPDAHTILQYGQYGGYLPLRQLLAEQYKVTADHVLVGNGSLQLQDLLAGLLVKKGDVVIVEQPSYDRAITTFRRHGAKIVGIPLEKDGVSIAALEKAIAQKTPVFMYLVPDFQNPSGVTTSAEKRQILVDLAQRHDFWLVEDVPYRPLRYSGEDLPLLREINEKCVITISSYSKLISPALRVGYLIAPAELVKPLIKLSEEIILSPVLPTQAAVLEFQKRGYLAPHVENLKQLYAHRLQALVAAIGSHLPNIPFFEPQGGFFVSMMIPEQRGEMNIVSRAKEVNVLLSEGRDFYADPLNPGLGERFIRLPFCALTPAQLEEGIKRLVSVIYY